MSTPAVHVRGAARGDHTVWSFGDPDSGVDAKPWADASSERRSVAEYIMVGCEWLL